MIVLHIKDKATAMIVVTNCMYSYGLGLGPVVITTL